MNIEIRIFQGQTKFEEFEAFVWAKKFNGWTPNFPVVHNTSVPDLKLYNEWMATKKLTPLQWARNLVSFYSGKGWQGCPHIFVAPNAIIALNSLVHPGIHTPSWNNFSWGIETVGEFEREKFDDEIKENLIAVLGILCSRIGMNPSDYKLGVRGLHYHKEDKATTHKTCPGKNMVKSTLIKDVMAYMNADSGNHAHVTVAAQLTDTSELTDEELTSIAWVQSRLNSLMNADLQIDNRMGPLTKKAVENFQQKVKLELVDGIPGPVTRKALKAGWN